MKRLLLATTILMQMLWLPATAVFGQSGTYTPKPGSPERQAVCDGMRAHVIPMADRRLPQPIVFQIGTMKIRGNYCFCECMPVFKDGSMAVGEYLPDADYVMCLQRTGKGVWTVILDLSRSDVPDDEEVREIRGRLPADFPRSIMSEFWRNLLQ